MAGEDFLPVGIKAVVVGVDKFLGDLRRMQTGVTKLGKSITATGVPLRTLSQNTKKVSDGAKLLDAQTKSLAADTLRYSYSVTNLNAALRSLVQNLSGVAPKAGLVKAAMDGLQQELDDTRNSAQVFFNSVAAGAQKVAQSTGIYANSAAKLARLTQEYERMKRVVDGVGKEQTENKRWGSHSFLQHTQVILLGRMS